MDLEERLSSSLSIECINEKKKKKPHIRSFKTLHYKKCSSVSVVTSERYKKLYRLEHVHNKRKIDV